MGLNLLACILASGILAPSAVAQTNRWTNSVSGFWHDPLNWSTGLPASTQQFTFVTNATTKVVTIDATTSGSFPGSMTISNLTIGAPAGTSNTLQLTNAGVATPLRIFNNFTLSASTAGSALLITNSALQVDGTVWRADGNSTILDGVVVATNSTVSVGSTTNGQMSVSGGDVRFAQLRIGDSGTGRGTLTITGGKVTVFKAAAQSFFVGFSAGSSGTVWLTGGQLVVSNATFIGDGGIGQMIISNATLHAPGAGGVVTIGQNAGSSGTLTVIGASAVVNISTNAGQGLLVGSGSGSTGTVSVVDGQINVGTGSTAIPSSGVGRMNLSNATATTRGLVTVASAAPGQGTLTVVDSLYTMGGQFFTIARAPGTTGTVWVTGSSQIFVTNTANAGYIIVGGSDISGGGVGTMIISNGFVKSNYGMVGPGSASRGTLTIAGGTMLVSSNLTIGGDPLFAFTGAGTGNVVIANGQLNVTNVNADGQFVVGQDGRGLYTQNGGIVTADQFLLTNATSSAFTFNAGTLSVLNQSAFSNSTATIIGDGAAGNSATLQFPSGNHLMNDGLLAGNSAGTTGTVVSTGGALIIPANVILGNYPCTAVGNFTVNGGDVSVTNTAGTATVDVRDGTVTLSAGALRIDHLVITNSCGHFIKASGTLVVGALDLDPALDADGDGIPNGWEQMFGLDPLDPTDAALDPDGDGNSSLLEYCAGTDPTNAASFFAVTSIIREGDGIRVMWTTGAGKTNALDRTPGDASGNYSTNSYATIFIVTNTVLGTTNYYDAGAATNFPARYYRVRCAM